MAVNWTKEQEQVIQFKKSGIFWSVQQLVPVRLRCLCSESLKR